MVADIVSKKEVLERKRQMVLIKGYFDNKKEVFEARLTKFLQMYPYAGNEGGADLKAFEMAYKCVSDDQKKEIALAFQQEVAYWNSSYVLDNCNCNIHRQIIMTLSNMSKILLGYGVHHENYTNNKVKKTVCGTATPENTYEVEKISKNSWGRLGEEAVDYVLKWLPDLYCVIEKDCVSKYSENAILLENPILTDETQEFDHLVIGPQGVFNIETKNYSGKVYIDKSGNWMRLKKGETEWTPEENPAQQLFRHHVMLQSILSDQVPIIDVICMSHPSLMISGQENSGIPIIKKDLLADFIVNYQPAGLSQNQVLAIRDKINSSKTSK